LIALSATVALIAAASSAHAAPASITVNVSPELMAKAQHDYGVRDIDDLAARLRRDVERQAAKAPSLDGARILLELTDAKPTRPTFKHPADHPGLSFESFGLGGAQIDGHAVLADGHVTPLSYRYYETDIRYAHLAGPWGDADNAIEQFAHRLGHGDLLA